MYNLTLMIEINVNCARGCLFLQLSLMYHISILREVEGLRDYKLIYSHLWSFMKEKKKHLQWTQIHRNRTNGQPLNSMSMANQI